MQLLGLAHLRLRFDFLLRNGASRTGGTVSEYRKQKTDMRPRTPTVFLGVPENRSAWCASRKLVHFVELGITADKPRRFSK